jgi:hypothetical protein
LKCFGPPISSMCCRLSSIGSCALLKNCASFVVPPGPPSADAPLSEMTDQRVVELTQPDGSSSRPIW